MDNQGWTLKAMFDPFMFTIYSYLLFMHSSTNVRPWTPVAYLHFIFKSDIFSPLPTTQFLQTGNWSSAISIRFLSFRSSHSLSLCFRERDFSNIEKWYLNMFPQGSQFTFNLSGTKPSFVAMRKCCKNLLASGKIFEMNFLMIVVFADTQKRCRCWLHHIGCQKCTKVCYFLPNPNPSFSCFKAGFLPYT